MSQVVKSQHNFGTIDFVLNSESIFLLKAIKIDSLEPEKHHSIFIQKNRLTFELIEDYSEHDVMANKTIEYQVTEHSHMHKAEPIIGDFYIAFVNYNEEIDAYILPEHKWSLVKVNSTNREDVKYIIKEIQDKPKLSQCDYFDLISINFDDPISTINRDLNNLVSTYPNIDSTFCIDVNKKNEIFENYLKTNNYRLLPYIRNYRNSEADSILLKKINELLEEIEVTKEMYWIEEASINLTNISNLSFIYNSTEAITELNIIQSDYYSKFDKIFVGQVKNLLKKYGS